MYDEINIENVCRMRAILIVKHLIFAAAFGQLQSHDNIDMSQDKPQTLQYLNSTINAKKR